ncbi:hypothetical protein C8Q77DRAFT_1086446 [Trametes polyzona]|nr:hypothetical protein C8Q77DRAFT_1086446 [Trametes polyzona]
MLPQWGFYHQLFSPDLHHHPSAFYQHRPHSRGQLRITTPHSRCSFESTPSSFLRAPCFHRSGSTPSNVDYLLSPWASGNHQIPLQCRAKN